MSFSNIQFTDIQYSMNQRPPIWDLLNRRFVTLWIISFSSGAFTAPAFSLLAIYIESVLQKPPIFSAGLRAALLVVGGFVAILGGALCDSIGRKHTYLLGMTGGVLAGLLFISTSPSVLIVLCLYNGICFGFLTTASQSYMMDSVSGRSLGLGAAIYFIGNTLGHSTGNFILAPLADTVGFRILGWIMTGGMSALFFGTLFLLPGSQPNFAGQPQRSVRKTLAGYPDLFQRPLPLMLMGLRFLPTCYWGAATLLIPLLIFRATGTSTAAAHFSAVSLIVAACFQLVVGRLCDRFGRKRPVLIASFFVTLSALGTGICIRSFEGLYLFGVIGAASAWSLSTTMPGLINDIVGPEEKGRMVGAAHLAWSLGMTSGSIGGGWLVTFQPALPFYITSILCALAFFLAWRICCRIYPVRVA